MAEEPAPQPIPNGPRHRFWAAVRAVLRTRIVTGLLTVIPIWVTYVIVRFVFDMMRSATEPLAKKIADVIIAENAKLIPEIIRSYYEMLPVDPARRQAAVHDGVSAVLAVLLTLFFLYALGFFSANVFGRRFILFLERMVGRVPMVKTIYRSVKQIVTTIGGADASKFHRVVLIEVPRPGMKRIAFLTSVMTDSDTGRPLANIFIPYTPYVTTGYMQIVPLDEVSETNWTVEEAVKLVMSGGILSPPAIPFDCPRPVHDVHPHGQRHASGEAAGKTGSMHETKNHRLDQES